MMKEDRWKARIEHKQTQHLTYMLTQNLSQTIYLLGLPLVELNEAITQEIEENPFIDIDEENYPPINQSLETKSNIDEIDSKEVISSELSDTQDYTTFKEFESYVKKNTSRSESLPTLLEAITSATESLYEHLIFQAKIDLQDERLFILATYLISEIDEDGYFRGNIEDFLGIENYKYTKEEIEEMLKRIQKYDPVGVGSRTLEECLLAQLEVFFEDIPYYDKAKLIISEDLERIAKNDIKELVKKYKISSKELEEIVNVIKSLDPKPGRNFSSKESQVIIPEAIVRIIDQEISIEFNDTYIPKVKIRQEIISAVKQTINEELKKKIVIAKNLVNAIEYRKELLRKIIEYIVYYQKDFFLSKTNYLEPLTAVQLAKELGVNVSTISRAIKDKYIQTPRGLLPLKFFLSREIKSLISNKHVSTKMVREMIREIIRNERKPLSDEKIASILINKGIKISRRTVAKYREEMGIPRASKREKKNEKRK